MVHKCEQPCREPLNPFNAELLADHSVRSMDLPDLSKNSHGRRREGYPGSNARTAWRNRSCSSPPTTT